MSKMVTCRTCKAKKWTGDICASCGKGMMKQTMRVSKGQPIGVFNLHGMHSPVSGVGRHRAAGHDI